MSILLLAFLCCFPALGHPGGVLGMAQPIVWGDRDWGISPPKRVLSEVGTHPTPAPAAGRAHRLLSKTGLP